MVKRKLVVICQSGGKFTTSSDGSLSYNGGEAHAITVSSESKFDELKLEMADMWNYDPNALTMKYFLPNNKKTLITISSNKDIQHMIDFHENSATVDIYVMKDDNPTTDVSPAPMPRNRSRKTTVSESVTPHSNSIPDASISEETGQLSTMTPPPSNAESFLLVDNLNLEVSNVGDAEQQELLKIWKNGITGLHQQFNSVHEFREALSRYSIAHGFSYTYKKNEGRRVTVHCKGEGCPWRIHASRVATTQLFRIKKMIETHTCGAGTDAANRPQASRKLLASIVREKLLETPHSKPREIAEEIRRDFGIELRYCQAWRGVETARKELQGSCKDSYNQLPWLSQKIVETNPGSVVSLNSREDLSFHQFFVAFHASLVGFQNGCRPLIFLDTTTIRSKFQSELLTATALDGNDGFFPIALAVVDVVNDANWQWFLMQLKSALTTICQPITFVADRLMGLRQSIPLIFENSFHGYCVDHLIEELKQQFDKTYTQEVVPVVIAHMEDAAQAATLDGFRKSIQSIKSISPEACDWILRTEPEHWANALFEGSRYNHNVCGVAKSFYSWVSELPALPILHVVDTIRCNIMELMYNCRVESNQWLTRLTPSLEDQLQKEIFKAQSLQVLLGLSSSFEVHDSLGAMHVVNVDLWDCSCREWQLNGYPCSHAVAVLQHIGKDLYDYCSKYYTTDAYRLTYSETINPISTADKPVHKESTPVQIHPPPLLQQYGPPKRRRIRSIGVVKRPLRCSKCNGMGHNKSTCHVNS
ncbi:uncharacterized protein LOC123216125 [Mangifera indica]|uniref:uncharacterized protein LOC123216125 n=1 Tax=Mangifera indica TaxID=29780 RepID=UPI001CFA6E20|nr:uncharacterized protein LOC123216125 [Mangifera indica]